MNDIPISAPDTDDGKVIHYNVNRILYEADQKKAEEAKKNDVEENKAKSGDQSKRHTPDQAALSDLAKDAKRKGVSNSEADTLLDLSKEQGMKTLDHREPPYHHVTGPHIHAGGQEHISVQDD